MGETMWAPEIIDEDEYDDIDEAHDDWDLLYGDGNKEYEAYVLCDGTKPGNYEFGPLRFEYAPFYVGHGLRGRSRKSCWISWQEYMKPTGFKSDKIRRIGKKKGSIRIEVINFFCTKKKAFIVEKKLMNLIPPEYLVANSVRHFCKLDWNEQDYAYYKLVMKIRDERDDEKGFRSR